MEDGVATGLTAGVVSLHFGNVSLGSSEMLTLTITNHGVPGTVTLGNAINHYSGAPSQSYSVVTATQNSCLTGVKSVRAARYR
jgi:hypothetical protein